MGSPAESRAVDARSDRIPHRPTTLSQTANQGEWRGARKYRTSDLSIIRAFGANLPACHNARFAGLTRDYA